MRPFEVRLSIPPLVPEILVELTNPSSRILFNSTDTCGTRRLDFKAIDETVPEPSDSVRSKILRWRPRTFLRIIGEELVNFSSPLEITIISLVISILILLNLK
ncbi:MAG: hypothetical protein CMA04_002975 [Methanobacteriota archaeon]|nr:MAG: hypothetical protein CMA04_005130 [Euryarchaeota archaeon]RAH09563.1 MAG: hypothetical protein CMA04_002975 [Euryarchaeota archaeon]